MKIVVDRDIPFLAGVLESRAAVVYREGRSISRTDLLDADALIVRTRTTCDRSLLEGTAIRFIASATIGYDHIDTEYCRQANIAWTAAPGCNSSSVQQYVAAALFSLSDMLGFPLAGKTIGVIGVGHVGTKVAALCRSLGMQVLLNDPPRARREGTGGFVPLETIVEQAEILTLHVPLNRTGEDRTLRLLDERLLARLKPQQVLLNTSRGEVVDSPALKTLLQKKGLAGCVLDVWEHEPAIDADLLGLVDVATPHIAGYSADGKANGTAMSVRALSRFFGLGLDAWFPRDIPLPAETEFELECGHRPAEEILGAAVQLTYNILADDLRLRRSPATFEAQRAGYPLRREFPAYTLRLRNAGAAVASAARAIGFTIVTSPLTEHYERT